MCILPFPSSVCCRKSGKYGLKNRPRGSHICLFCHVPRAEKGQLQMKPGCQFYTDLPSHIVAALAELVCPNLIHRSSLMPVASKLSRPDELQSVESCRTSYKQSHWVQSCKHLSNPASKESTIAAQAHFKSFPQTEDTVLCVYM